MYNNDYQFFVCINFMLRKSCYNLQKSEQDGESVPVPIVLIDQDSDSDATLVQVSFGDRLGALIDTVKEL